jgi:uncharacterized protein (DUF849 family)
VAAVRRAVPGLEISCSTQKDIDTGDAADRAQAVRGWRDPPDVVSLNLAEPGTIELGHVLLESGIGIEAGVFTVSDADALLRAPWAELVHRVLVEVIFEHDDARAVSLAQAIDERVAGLGRPRLWHGDARANWAVLDAGIAMGMDVRVGWRTRCSTGTARQRPPTPTKSLRSRPCWPKPFLLSPVSLDIRPGKPHAAVLSPSSHDAGAPASDRGRT